MQSGKALNWLLAGRHPGIRELIRPVWEGVAETDVAHCKLQHTLYHDAADATAAAAALLLAAAPGEQHGRRCDGEVQGAWQGLLRRETIR